MIWGYLLIGLLVMRLVDILMNHLIWCKLRRMESDSAYEVPWNWRLLVNGFLYMFWLTTPEEEEDFDARTGA